MAGQKVALVIGAGDATGGAIARRFAREGYVACPVRRHADKLAPLCEQIEKAGGVVWPFGVDARDEDQMVQMVATIENDIGPIEVAVFNIGGNVRFAIGDTTARVYRKVWEMCAFAGFLMGREVSRGMVAREKGTIIFTGATASIRGGSGFAAFAGGKFALRALAQAMARELGPKGVHVAHSVIDGAIDTAFIRDNFPERYASKAQDGVLDPDAIAEAYWAVHVQSRSAWTHEFDLRPWIETW
jgi:NAD(P)-dependent dehydrogenase (short-subunit alcohol dehydrogenase family)